MTFQSYIHSFFSFNCCWNNISISSSVSFFGGSVLINGVPRLTYGFKSGFVNSGTCFRGSEKQNKDLRNIHTTIWGSFSSWITNLPFLVMNPAFCTRKKKIENPKPRRRERGLHWHPCPCRSSCCPWWKNVKKKEQKKRRSDHLEDIRPFNTLLPNFPITTTSTHNKNANVIQGSKASPGVGQTASDAMSLLFTC